MITCNIFQMRPTGALSDFWPFQYDEGAESTEKTDHEKEVTFTPDYFTDKAIAFTQRVTARETFQLSLKDVMGMDYGTLLHLEKIIDTIEEERAKEADRLEKQAKEKE